MSAATSGAGSAPAQVLDSSLLLRFAAIGVQLALLALAMQRFGIENEGFQKLAWLAFAGFAVHFWLPPAWRLGFFLALSLAGFVLVLGAANAAWLVAVALALIGVCHLPAPWSVRIGLLLAAGAGLSWLRMQPMGAPWSASLWPILSAVLMFRLIVYVYDLRHDKKPGTKLQALSYFFLLPNASFPLFPVIDYTTFRKSYYGAPEPQLHQRGVDWMVRGVVQLLLYRVIYFHLTIEASEVRGPFELLQYLATNFLLYLRVSGQFHLIVGMLHLFGFHLPETNHQYALSSSFTDFWRRINIYWKDFMLKVFYYPAFFRLRKRGTKTALVGATLFVFVVTWFLHSYQWFWLRGSFPVTWQDVIFWGALAGLVVHGTLREADLAHRKRKQAGEALWKRALSTVGTFLAICTLWSIWTADTIPAWLLLWENGLAWHGAPELAPLSTWAPSLAIALGCAGVFWAARTLPARVLPRVAPQAASLAAIALLLVLSAGKAQSALGSGGELLASIEQSQLNATDVARMQRGYYEELIDMDRFSSPVWELELKKPASRPKLHATELARPVRSWMKLEVQPSVSIEYHGALTTTNRWGMRDQDYALEKPPGTWRAVLIGSSHLMGSGVRDDETFEAQIEKKLNETRPGGYARYELLNFGVESFTAPQQLDDLRTRALRFAPDAAIYVAHSIDRTKARNHVAEAHDRGIEIPHAYLRELLAKAGAQPGEGEPAIQQKLVPFAEEILRWSYAEFVRSAREAGAVPIWLLIPTPKNETAEEIVASTTQLARDAGFIVIDEVQSAYSHLPWEEVAVAEWDDHPNAKGHALIAERTLEALVERESEIWRTPASRVAEENPEVSPLENAQ